MLSALQTLTLYRVGLSVQEIARARTLGEGTVVDHLSALIEAGENLEWERLIPGEQYATIVAAIEQVGDATIAPLEALLGTEVSPNAIRIARVVYRRTRGAPSR